MTYQVTGSEITLLDATPLVSGSVNLVKASFVFDEAWEGYSKTAVFCAVSATTEIAREVALDDAGTCVVPWEVLLPDSKLTVGVYGVRGNQRRPTIYCAPLFVERGAEPTEETRTPSPTVYEQLRSEMGNLEQLATQDKSNLVAAVNEAARSGGGMAADVYDPQGMAQDVFAYVDEAVAEIPVPDVSVQIGVHNTSTDAHSALFAGKAAANHTHTAADVGATPAAHASDTTIHITAAERTTWNDKANSSHTHDDRYYTEIEINTLLTGKAATNHTHTAAQVGAATESYVDNAIAAIPAPDVSGQIEAHNEAADAHSTLFAGKAAANHTHTADEVGARPSTWTPSAQDVGAATEKYVNDAIVSAIGAAIGGSY